MVWTIFNQNISMWQDTSFFQKHEYSPLEWRDTISLTSTGPENGLVRDIVEFSYLLKLTDGIANHLFPQHLIIFI